MSGRKPLALYAITAHGLGVAERLRAGVPGAELYVSEKLSGRAPAGSLPMPLPMGPTLKRTFAAYDGHVFVVSVGAVVRMITPLIEDKKTDPAVVCVDDTARFAVCVLSGHVGRGNELTDRVAGLLGAQSVVTTASDVRGTFAVDILGRELGWTLDDPDRNVTRGCAAVVSEGPVLFVQECGEPSFWPEARPLPPGIRYATSLQGVDPAAWEILLIASDRDLAATQPGCLENAIVYRPKSLVLGIGCDKQTPADLVERGVASLLAKHGLSPRSVKAVATADIKAEEPAIRELCAQRGWALVTYGAAELDAVEVPTPSEVVKRHVGTRGVAEPAALLAAKAQTLIVAKQVYTEPGAGRSMTFAVARVPHLPRKEARS